MADPVRFHCESGHKGLVPKPIARCPICNAPVRISAKFAGIATDEELAVQYASVCERVVGLGDALAEIVRVIHNVCAVEGITIADLSPQLIVSPQGVMVIDLLAPATEAA